jgi:D-alanyl-D-alanine carboxypeptidase
MRCLATIFAWFVLSTATALADAPKRYASIVVDADTLEIIHARQIDDARYPASLTKVMTLYLTFDAINSGALKLSDRMTVSRAAARTAPVDIGLRAGQTISVDEAIQALTVRSANDAAAVLAERIGGTQENFAAMMTRKARELHMRRTTFMTPHGLPHPDQTTTARDMAKLAAATLNHHRRYYHYFGQTKFVYKGRTYKNTNGLLHWLSGVDGFKTGYTNASGYNLIISAQRDGRRLIAVVLGGATSDSRNKHMQDLVERGFDALGVSPVISTPPLSAKRQPAEPKIEPKLAKTTEIVRLRGHGNETIIYNSSGHKVKVPSRTYDRAWAVQVGAFKLEKSAQKQIDSLAANKSLKLNSETAKVVPLRRGSDTMYRARFTGISALDAQDICQALTRLSKDCLVIAPSSQ